MSLHHTSSQRSARSLGSSAATSRLQGGTLTLARGLWITVAVAVLAIFFATLPANFAYLHTVSTTATSLSYGQLTSSGFRQLRELGLSIDFYATFLVVSNVIFVLVWFAVGVLIFWRKSDERLALLASLTLVMFPIGFTDTIRVAALPPTWQLPVQCMQFLGGMVLSLFLYVFPDGRFVPRWTPWLLIVWVIENSDVTFFAISPINPSVHSLIDGFLFIGLLCSIVAVQVYRYRRVSTPVQRQQTKWVVFGTTTGILGFIVALIVGTLFVPASAQSGPLASMIGNTALHLFLLLIPLSIGVAILRSRLWEIDVIINRTLVYGTLTVLLALVYFGLVIGLESLVHLVTGQASLSPVIIVASTLVIAALFQPLRHRLQKIIDRRFYRHKYDAAKVIAAFSSTLRNEVDLDQLREQLIAVVQETMQPSHVSLWVRKPGRAEVPSLQVGKPPHDEADVHEEIAGHSV
jgi:hypothetical protein